MPLIGEGTNAGLGAMDYSNVARSAWALAESNADAFKTGFGGLMGAVTDVVKDRKEKKDRVKTGAELLDAAMKLYPETAQAFEGVAAALKDEEKPLSERAALGSQVGELINLGVRSRDTAFNQQMDLMAAARADRGMAISEGQAQREAQQFDFTMGQAESNRDTQQQISGMVAPALLEQAISMARDIESKGGRAPIDPDVLQEALQTGTPEAGIKLAETFNALLPEQEKPEFRDINVTIDGQPSTVTAAFNRNTGSFDIVPVNDGMVLPPKESEVFSVPTTNYSTGKDAGGPDEMQDKWTNRGYSSTGKNLTPGIVAVNDKAFPLGTVFKDADTGEVFIAGDRHGNKNPNVIDIYQPPGAYTQSKGSRNLQVIGHEEAVGKTPEEVQRQLDRYRGSRITPGAAKGTATPKTETEQKLDEARLRNLEASNANKNADLAKQTDAKATAKASAENALTLIDQLRKHPGFSGAVGMSLTPGFLPATDRKGAEAIIDQLKGQSFLTAIQQLRGLGALSDAEGAKLQQAAVRLDASQSEKDFMIALSDYEKQIREALGRLGGSGESTPAPSASDRLRARINGQ